MQREWSQDSSVRRKPDVVWRSFERELALLDPGSGRFGSLNEVAARCWELADGRTFGELLACLMNEFEVERTELERDVRDFLNHLDARGLLAAGAP